MKDNQKFTPKYWVLHNKIEDDVYLSTACKSYPDAVLQAQDLLGEDWFMDDNFEVILVEIKKVG